MSFQQEELGDSLEGPVLIDEIPTDDNCIVIEEEALKAEEPKEQDLEEELCSIQASEDSNEVQKINQDLAASPVPGHITPKPNRELKSILELSKEANLDTNIAHKRKSVEPGGKVVDKAEPVAKRRSSVDSGSEGSRIDRKPKAEDKQPRGPDAESLSSISDNEDNKETKDKDCLGNKISKRKKDSFSDSNTGGAVDQHGKRTRKSSANLIITMNNKKKDPFCWRCHHLGVNVHCETCPRSYHSRCLKQNISQPNHWLCPECMIILKAENLKERSPAMRDMSLEHLCGLLKFALKRMLDVSGCEPFINPVSESEFPDYKNYIVQPMDLTCLEKNIKDNVYGSTQAFEADAKWILHNSIIFNSYQSKLTTIAKGIIKVCKQEMSEIENCANCYLNANTKKRTWFVEVCPKPHLLVWAKLKGFPYWPAKAMRSNSQGLIDVRFFGAHDRAWVPNRECFLYSLKDPNSTKVKRNDINESIKELNVHIENLKKVYGEFRYAPYRVVLEPGQEMKHLHCMLPRYRIDGKIKATPMKKSSRVTTNGASSPDNTEKSQSTLEANESNVDEDMCKSDKNNSSISVMEDEEIEEEMDQEALENNKYPDADDAQHIYNTILGDPNSYINTPSARVGKVRMRGGYTNTSGKLKILPKLVPLDSETKKRISCDDYETPTKLSRRNSDQSIKSDSSRLSNVSDKINKVDISEDMEISMGNDASGGLQISENISPITEISNLSEVEITLDSKRKPIVQVNISGNENAEFTISPQSKSKIADRLMKKLAEPVDSNDTVESVKKKIVDADVANEIATEADLSIEKFKDSSLMVLEKITELSPDTEIFETNLELNKLADKNSMDSSQLKVAASDDSSNYENTENSNESSEVTSSEEENVDINGASKKESDDSYSSNGNKSDDTVCKGDRQSNSVRKDVFVSSTSEQVSDIYEGIQANGGKSSAPVSDEKITSKNAEIQEKLNSCADTHEQKKSETAQQQPRNKRKRSSNSTEAEVMANSLSLQKQLITVVNIDDIKNKNLDRESPQKKNANGKSILEDRLVLGGQKNAAEDTSSVEQNGIRDGSNADTVVIKSEASSDDEPSDSEYMELKRKYLSALDLNESEKAAEKSKTNEIRTRSKTEEKKFRVVDNMSKVIDDVATHYSAEHANDEITLPNNAKRKEIFIKPLSKMQIQIPKQRARKSFPMPIKFAGKKDVVVKPAAKTVGGSIANLLTKSTTNSITITGKTSETFTSGGNIMFLTTQPTIANNLTLLPTSQSLSYPANIANPMLTMVQHSICSGTTLNNVIIQPSTAPALPPTNTNGNQNESHVESESQNYIPQSGATSKATTTTKPTTSNSSDTSSSMPVLAPLPIVASATISSSNSNSIESSARPAEPTDDFHVLNSFMPETLTKSISEIICRAPPMLKPRPPGPLGTQFDEGLPSSAGPVTSKVNSISHRLGDYFRGMLVELLKEMGHSDNPEAEICKLRLENEELRHKHAEEILEIKKNISSVLKDIQKSLVDERNRVIDDTRTTCEAECVKRVEEAKSKQWCANCSKEAQFYCCWNTSYCDYPCQQKHWPKHMSKCTQNIQNVQIQSTNSGSTAKPPSQQLVLRQTTAPKGFAKTLIAKPTKLFYNRTGGNKNAINVVRATSSNHITLVEATPGNFELLGNGGPISIGGKFITSMSKLKTSNVISVASPSSSGCTVVSGSVPKQTTPKQQSPLVPKNSVTIVSDDELFCCLKGCLNGIGFGSAAPHIPRENPIQLDTAFMGYEVVIVKGGQRVCGAGAALGNAPLVQSKSYFEVKIQQGGSWSIGLATRQTDLSLTQGGMDEYSWSLCSDHVIRHNKQDLYRIGTTSLIPNGNSAAHLVPQEGDIVGVSYDHIQLKFYVNGVELEYPIVNVKGTVYPALYVDDGAILDIIFENFNHSPPIGFEKIMLEQSLL